MKQVKINAYHVGLVFKDGAYVKMLTAGKYWFWNNEQVHIYDLTKTFIPPVELNILLQDAALAEMLHVVLVKDGQLVLKYENGLLMSVLHPARYAFWKGVTDYRFVVADVTAIDIDEKIDKTTLQNKLLAPFIRTYTVESYEKALLFVDGKYDRELKPGTYTWWKNSITIHVGKVDARMQQMEINGQEILTKDKATIRVNAFAQYRVAVVEKALRDNKEYDKQLYVAFQLALREYIGGYLLDEMLINKESVSAYVLEAVKQRALQLGVEVEAFGIRDIILPGDVKEIMNQVLVAEKKAQANTIMRREETASTRSLLNTAKLMEENTMLWKLKEMEYVEKIADKIGEITVSGNGVLVEQLKQLFTPK